MRFKGKTFYFMRKSPWDISEAAGVFCIEQAPKIMGGSKLNPPRCGSMGAAGRKQELKTKTTEAKWRAALQARLPPFDVGIALRPIPDFLTPHFL
jgi:hypothetical protein